MVDKEAVLQGYDDIASTYLEGRSPSDEEREALTTFLDSLPNDARVLDSGCGGGEPVLKRVADSHRPVGVDFSAAQLEIAKSTVPEAGLVRGDMTRLPVAENSVDAVVAYHSLIHVPSGDHRPVLDEFARVLRPGGRLLVSEGPEEWAGTSLDWLGTGTEMGWYIAGAAATRKQLAAARFCIEREYGAPNTLAEDDEAAWVFFDAVLDRE